MSNLKSGLSGCKLELLDNLSLRKYSSSMEYNSRLSSQIEKQKLFSNFILKNIDTPKIYNSNFESLYYFDMEYELFSDIDLFFNEIVYVTGDLVLPVGDYNNSFNK